jgi:SAM-dependent methyltransferase
MATRYDQIPYPGFSYPQTHPDRVVAMARVAGFVDELPSVQSARVLELGCGDAATLIAIAYAWPGTQCVGLDLSSQAIARGQRVVDVLSLANVKLITADLRKADELATSPFDFIIAHGLYSWVPHDVADAAMSLCARLLAPNGLAFFSYDVFPGAHLKSIARELMNLAPDDPKRLLAAAAMSVGATEPWAAIYRNENERVSRIVDGIVAHDDLSEIYRPTRLTDFVEHASRHGLQFLTEADPIDIFPPTLPDGAARLIDQLSQGDVIRREQASDYLRGRRFRQTILCRADVQLNRTAPPSRLAPLHFATALKPDEQSPGTFRLPSNASVTLTDPSAISALTILGRAWPATMRFDELCEQVGKADRAQAVVAETLLRTSGARLVEIHAAPVPAATVVPQRPAASALARFQSSVSGDEVQVTTLTGQPMHLRGKAVRALLDLLDGTRTASQVTAELRVQLNQPTLPESEVVARIKELVDLRMILPAREA